MHGRGITKGASPTRLIMDKAARLVCPETFFAPSDDGCVPMTIIHTGDNMDLKPNNHYILTAVMTVGSTLSAAHSPSKAGWFAAMPPVDTAAGLRGIQMTASDEAALDRWTTQPHTIRHCAIRALRTAAVMRASGFDKRDDASDEIAAAAGPPVQPRRFADGVMVSILAEHRTMDGIVRGYVAPHYTLHVLMGARTRTYRVHASNVERARQTAPAQGQGGGAAPAQGQGGGAVPRRRTAAAAGTAPVDPNNPDRLDPFGLNQRFAYAPT